MENKSKATVFIGGGILGFILMGTAFLLTRLGLLGWLLSFALSAAACAALTLAAVKWHELSITDDTTGLYNRRYLFQRLSLEIRLCERKHFPLSLVVIDVDDFRQFNSTYGHLGGDKVLVSIANTLKRGIRKGDIIGRWGGEEFAIILPGADLAEAAAVAERIRGNVEAESYSLDSVKVKATISAGLATRDSRQEYNLKELVSRADQAMYIAKRSKNRVVSYQAAEG